MFIDHESNLPSHAMRSPEVRNAALAVLAGPETGWPGHVMRMVTLETDGHTPRHAHPWPHINYVVEGRGVLCLGDGDHPLSPGSVIVVPPDTVHQYRNSGDGRLRFICIVPEEGHVV